MRAGIVAAGVGLLVCAAPASAQVSTGDQPAPSQGVLPPDADPPPNISGIERDGETLTGADGFDGAATRDRIWLSCSQAETGCVQVATTNEYTLSPADVDKVLKFRVRGTSTFGGYREAEDVTGVVAAIPTANVTAPQVSGIARQGEVLSASNDTWDGTQPLSYAYQWQRCDPTCTDVVASRSSYAVAAADVGNKLKLTVTATGPGGSASASDLSDTVAPRPATGGSGSGTGTGTGTTFLRLLSPFPVVAIGGRVVGRGARITQLRISRVARGAAVTVTCKGRDCPFRRFRRKVRRGSGMRIRGLERSLRAGTVIVIIVRKGNTIGKYTRLRIRRGAPPARVDRCIRPGARRSSRCPV